MSHTNQGPQDEAIHRRIFAADRGGYDPALNHYRALYRDLNLADEKRKPPRSPHIPFPLPLPYILTKFFFLLITVIPASAQNLTKPVLLLTAAQDPVGTPDRAERSTSPFAPVFSVRGIDSGHFLMLEKAEEVNEALRGFFEGG